MDEAVIKKLFDLCRLTTFLKARYPQWNETTDGVNSVNTQLLKQYSNKSAAVSSEVYNPLLRYEKVSQVFEDQYQKLNLNEQAEINAGKNEVQKYALVFLKDDVETHLSRIITAIEENNNAGTNDLFLKDEEKNWAQIYGQMFGKEALSDMYGLYNRKEPNVTLPDRESFQYFMPEVNYERAKILTKRSEEEKIFLKSFYPQWDEKSALNTFNEEENQIFQRYRIHQKEIDKLYEQMDSFQQFSFNVEREMIAESCEKAFQKKLENMITDEYTAYKAQKEPVWNFSLLNKYADIYRQRYGTEALMKIPTVQKIKEEFHLPETPQKNEPAPQKMNEKTENKDNNKQQGLSSILTQNSGAEKQELNLLSNPTDTVSAVFSARTNDRFV